MKEGGGPQGKEAGGKGLGGPWDLGFRKALPH